MCVCVRVQVYMCVWIPGILQVSSSTEAGSLTESGVLHFSQLG